MTLEEIKKVAHVVCLATDGNTGKWESLLTVSFPEFRFYTIEKDGPIKAVDWFVEQI